MAKADRRLVSAAELNQLKAFVPKSDAARHGKFETLIKAMALGVEVAADIPVIADTRTQMLKAARAEAGLDQEQPNRQLSQADVERLNDSLKKSEGGGAGGNSHTD